MIIGIGSDLCNIERIQNSLDRFGDRFTNRVFTDIERSRAERRPLTRAGTYAKRFAAKEAFSKAVGTGFKRGVFMKDIGVVNKSSGEPTLALTGGAKQRLDDITPAGHAAHIYLTMTDDHPFAQAFVIITAVPVSADTRSMRVSASDPAVLGTEESDKPAALPAEKKGTDWWGEIKSIFWLILAVLAFHSFVAKPFYIPSESMMPILLKGDRLVVSKYPYGWSWVSPSFHIFPETDGRLFGSLPERGDIVIVTPPGQSADYIKRAIGLPGDELELIEGQLYINGTAIKRQAMAPTMIPVDDNTPCSPMEFPGARVTGPGGKLFCRLPIIRETLPNGRSYDTIDLGYFPVDDFAKIKVPANHVFLMGDNRDKSADSRVSLQDQGLGGPVPYENIGGRAEFVTFSLDGTSQYLNPISWFTALRGGRAGNSLHPQRSNGK